MKWLLHEFEGIILACPMLNSIFSENFALGEVISKNSVLSSLILSLFRIIHVLISEIQAEMEEIVSDGDFRSQVQYS